MTDVGCNKFYKQQNINKIMSTTNAYDKTIHKCSSFTSLYTFCINPTFPHFITIVIIIIIAAVVIIIAIVVAIVAVGVTFVADTHHTENLNIQSHYCPDRL